MMFSDIPIRNAGRTTLTDSVVSPMLSQEACDLLAGLVSADAEQVVDETTTNRSQAVTQHIANAVAKANAEVWGFDLRGMEHSDPITVERFEGSTGDGRALQSPLDKQHSTRKITVVVTLSDPEEYSGGELHFLVQDTTLPPFQGQAVVMPSFSAYKIKPVTRGSLAVLTAHVHGPVFR